MAQGFPRGARPWLLALAAVCVAAAGAAAEPEGGEKVYQRTIKSTVWVLPVEDGGRIRSSGTGTLIDRTKGVIVTNYHVVNENDKVMIFFPIYQRGKLVTSRSTYLDLARSNSGIAGKVIALEKKKDLALIHIDAVPADAQELRLARDSVSPGQRVHSIGNPGKSSALWLYTQGNVRQVSHKKWRASGSGERTYDFEAEVIETQSPTNPGDSGGPLVNDRAELVGVTQGTANDAQLLSIFVDISEVKLLLKSNKLVAKLAPVTPGKPAEAKTTADKPAEKAVEAGGNEHLAATKLRFAHTLAKEGKTEKARERYEDIVKQYPNTDAAKEARAALEKLGK
jgi:S1-C subfamily serine protease